MLNVESTKTRTQNLNLPGLEFRIEMVKEPYTETRSLVETLELKRINILIS